MNSLEKNLRMLPRTLSEANRDAEYATAIQRPHSEWADMANFVGGLLITSPLWGGAVYVLYLVLKGL